MPMQPPKPTVPTSLPMYFMVSNSAKHGTTCAHYALVIDVRMTLQIASQHAQLAIIHMLHLAIYNLVICI